MNNITSSIQKELKNMYYEMQEQFLHTVLIPAPDPMHTGHMIRVADNTNPDWYRELCANNLSTCKSHKDRYENKETISSTIFIRSSKTSAI